MLFDTHAHMDDRAFDEDRAQLLASLPDQQIALLMNPGCSLESSRNVCKLAQQYDYIYGAVGSHPDVADEVNDAVIEENCMIGAGALVTGGTHIPAGSLVCVVRQINTCRPYHRHQVP